MKKTYNKSLQLIHKSGAPIVAPLLLSTELNRYKNNEGDNMGRYRYISVILFCVFLLNGCATTYRQYSGPELPEDKIGILEHSPIGSNTGMIIEDVDGKWRGAGLIERYELLPGEHSITCTLRNPLMTSKKVTTYFKVEAGKRYIAQDVHKGDKWGVVVLEKNSGQIVSYYKPEK